MKRFSLLLVCSLCLLELPALLIAQQPIVAVGYGGRRMLSLDGQTWEITGEWEVNGGDNSNNLMSAVYAQNLFVVTGGGGGGSSSAGHILTSQDGKTWKEVLTTKARVNPVEYGNERFVAGVSGYPAGKFLWSTDAENWQEGIRLDDKQCTHFRRGAFGNSRFVITGNHGGNSPSWIAVTSNGEDVLAIDHSLEKLREICFAEGVFVVVGEGIRHNSVDGINWKSSQVDPAEPLRWVVHNGTQFFCGGGKSVYVSDDGVNWDTHPMRPRGNVLWMNGEQAIATGWPGKMFYSADTGSTWKQSAEMTPNGINVIVRAVQSH